MRKILVRAMHCKGALRAFTPHPRVEAQQGIQVRLCLQAVGA